MVRLSDQFHEASLVSLSNTVANNHGRHHAPLIVADTNMAGRGCNLLLLNSLRNNNGFSAPVGFVQVPLACRNSDRNSVFDFEENIGI